MTDDYGTSSPGTGTPPSSGWPADDQPTTQLPSVPPVGDGRSSSGSTTEVAKDEAAGVASSAKEKAAGLVDEGVDKARSVAGEAGRQARDLMAEARVELTAQAYDQQRRLAGGLRTFGNELSSMAESSSEGGLAADVARQLASRTTDLAQWFEDREPGSVLEEVKEFARRRPGAFLAIAAGAGVLAGRVTRGLKDAEEPGAGATAGTTGRRAATAPVDAGTPQRVSAWPSTGVEPQGAGYPARQGVTAAGTAQQRGAYESTGTGFAGSGYDTAGTGFAGTGYDTAGTGYAGGGYRSTETGAGGYDDSGYGTGADETADPLDAPLSAPLPDPMTDPAREPHDEEGWR